VEAQRPVGGFCEHAIEEQRPHAKEAMREDATAEEGAELPFDEAGQPDPVGLRGGRGEEGLQMLPDIPCRTVSAAARGT